MGESSAKTSELNPVPARRRPERLSVSAVAETPWLRLEVVKYQDAFGKERDWSRAVRPQTKSEDTADAECALPIIDTPEGPAIILVSQYRPPVDKMTLEFPAGLKDQADHTPGVAAIRELREETGYVAEPCFVSPRTCLSPGMSTESINLAVCTIDATLPANRTLATQFDDGEDITTKVILLKGLRAKLDQLTIRENYLVFDSVYAFAMGLEMGSRLERRTENETLSESVRKIYMH